MASVRERIDIALKAREEFEYFTQLVFGIKVQPHERPWFDNLQALADGKLTNDGKPTSKLLLIAPPGSGKSQIVAIAFLSWMIGKNPDKHYGLISYADKVAWERSGTVRKLIEVDRGYKLVFPEDIEWAQELGVPPVIPDLASWSVAGFRVLRRNLGDSHPTLRAGGVNSSIVSYRLDGLVIDDPINVKDATTLEIKEKGFKNYEHAILTRIVEDSWQAVVGTRFADDDFIGRVQKRKNDNWKVVHIKALSARGHSYWPEKYSDKYLQGIREDAPEMFQLQYQGDPSSSANRIIKHLITYEELPEFRLEPINITQGRVNDVVLTRTLWVDGQPRDLLIGAGVDTAMKTKQQNDYSVIYIGGIDKYGVLWILDRRKGRWSLLELVDQFKEVNDLWLPYLFWVEDTANGTPAAQTIISEHPNFPIKLENATQGGKHSRVNTLSLFIHDGRVRFPRAADWYEDAEYYLTHFGNVSFDDDADALYQLVRNLQLVRHPALYSQDNRPKQRFIMR